MAGTKTIITSFTNEGFEQYGRKFLKTLCHWPRDIRVIVYYEGDAFPEEIDREEYQSINHIKGHDEFMSMLKFPLMRGKMGKKYNINFDARMCRKSLMHIHAGALGGKVFWVDADCLTHSKVPDGFLDEVLPDGKLCCYLGRDYMYTESGFMGFDTTHPHYHEFMKGLWNTLFSGLLFQLPGWHDCYAFDYVREHFPENDFVNLSANIPKHRGVHPFVNSVLGKHMDHLKGLRKKSGKSSKNDLIQPRKEMYWRA